MSFRRNVLVALASSIAGIPYLPRRHRTIPLPTWATSGGSTSRAFAINASGQVVGGSTILRLVARTIRLVLQRWQDDRPRTLCGS